MSDAFIWTIYIVCLALHVGIYLLHRDIADPYSERVVQTTLLFLACHGVILLLAAAFALRRRGVVGWILRHLPKRKAKETASDKTKDAAAKEGAAWDSLPILAIPALGRSAREAVIAFAQQHSLRPYEAERGYVVADRQGNYYRAAVD